MKAQIKMQLLLKNKLSDIKSRNPSYSVRSFASKIGIAPSTLSLIMLGKRRVSIQLARKIADKLMLDPQEKSEVIPVKESLTSHEPMPENYMQLSCDQFNLISEWHYFAILNLIHTKDFQSDVQWISSRLGLSNKKVEEALELLKRLNLIKESETGTLKRVKSKYRTTDGKNDVALRKSHYDTLTIAQEKLLATPLEQRDFTWITFAFDLAKMDEAKQLIRRFQDEFLDLINKDAEHSEVYRLAVQLFPLSLSSKNKIVSQK